MSSANSKLGQLSTIKPLVWLYEKSKLSSPNTSMAKPDFKLPFISITLLLSSFLAIMVAATKGVWKKFKPALNPNSGFDLVVSIFKVGLPMYLPSVPLFVLAN